MADDALPAVAATVSFATSLDPDLNKVELVKVYREVHVVVPEQNAPEGRNNTLRAWLRFLGPIPVPASVRGTRADYFWSRVAKETRSHPTMRVVGVLFGDGFSEGSNLTEFRRTAKDLASLSNFIGAAYVGIAPGAFEEIEQQMQPLKKQSRLAMLPDVRDRKGNIDKLKALGGAR